MKTKFSIISYFDPFGDGKSERKYFKRVNFESSLNLNEVAKRINNFNQKQNYYSSVSISSFDNRIKTCRNFDNHYYNVK